MKVLLRIFPFLFLLIWQGCAPNKQLVYHLDLSKRLQEEGQLEEALLEYEMALKIDTDNKEALSGIRTVKTRLSEQYTAQAMDFMNRNKLTSAKERLTKVFQLIPAYPPAIDSIGKIKEKEGMIRNLYERATKLISSHEYLEAKDAYEKILQLNEEEGKAKDFLDKTAEEAWQYYVKVGNDFSRAGEWKKGNEYYLMAKSFKTNETIEALLEKASKALKAIRLCEEAEMLMAKAQAERAFNMVEEAKTLFPEGVPQCSSVFQKASNFLANKNYLEGLDFRQKREWKKAYEAFLKTVSYVPNYKDSSTLLSLAKDEFLKELYRETLSLIHQQKWEDAYGKVTKIRAISPLFGESSDLLVESIWNNAQEYYSKGIKHSKNGFHANAWIQFNAAASIVPNFLEVKKLMEKEKENIRLRTHRKVVVLPFFSLNPEPVLMPLLKMGLHSFFSKKSYKNISIDTNPLKDDLLYISSDNWLEIIKSLSADWVLVGWINYIKLDHSVKSSFSQRKYRTTEKVLNPDYIQAQNELKLSYNQLQTEVLEKKGEWEEALESYTDFLEAYADEDSAEFKEAMAFLEERMKKARTDN